MRAVPPRPGSVAPVLSLLLVALLLTSCAGGADEPPPAPVPSSPERIPTDAPPPGEAPLDRPVPVPDPLTSAPPPGATAVAADRVDGAGLPPGFPPLVWTRGPATVGVYGRAGGCTEARAAVVEQDAQRVVLRVEQVTTSPGPCTRELLYPPLEVTLDAPLDDRRVVLRGEVR